jgi:hypothetical protein
MYKILICPCCSPQADVAGPCALCISSNLSLPISNNLQPTGVTHLQSPNARCEEQNQPNLKVTLHTIILEVADTIYNEFTMSPLIRLGLTTQKARNLASTFSCHSIHRFPKIIHPCTLPTRGFWGGCCRGRGSADEQETLSTQAHG